MTKSEKIQEAWGILYDTVKEHLTENGWCDFKKVFGDCGNTKPVQGLVLETMDNYSPKYCYYKRPAALNGIENNNGWVKIESESDLPNESSAYWILQSDGLIQTFKEYEDNKKYWKIKATHYMQITKPKIPIY